MQPVSQGPCHEPKQQDRDDRHSVIGKRVHGPSERPIGIVADIDALSAEPVVHDGRGVNADIDRRNERDDVHDPIAQRILRRRNGHVDAKVARLRAQFLPGRIPIDQIARDQPREILVQLLHSPGELDDRGVGGAGRSPAAHHQGGLVEIAQKLFEAEALIGEEGRVLAGFLSRRQPPLHVAGFRPLPIGRIPVLAKVLLAQAGRAAHQLGDRRWGHVPDGVHAAMNA